MRKVLSFVLVLTLVLGSFGFVFADDAADAPKTNAAAKTSKLSDIEGLDCEDAVRVLSSLEVVSGYEDGSYKPEQTVTRAEMASLLIKALGLKETNAVPKFTDSQNHWAKGFIAYANTLGIISGRTATVFDPDATVTYDEATTMIIKALGYTDDSLVGTYPASYVSRAKVLGILDGIQTGAAGANRGDIATMIYQALDQAIGKVDKDGNFNETVIEWAKGKGDASDRVKRYDTMLERLGAKMYDVADFYDDEDQNFIVTGDEDAVINLTPFKGALVSAYMNKDKDIIAVKEVFSTFVSGTIDDDTIGDYTLKAEAVTDITGSTPSAILFENGDEASFTIDRNERENYTLAVDLSGKKINEVYSVAKWTVSADAVLEAEDIKDIESNHKFLGVDFEENNNDDIDLDAFELYGVASLDDIKADMVAYVYKSNDNDTIARIAVGDKTVTGEVTRVSKDEDEVTIDGTVYTYAMDELAGNGAPGEASVGDIKAGNEVKLTLDAYGYIYDFEKTDSKADKFAIVLKIEDKEGNKITSDAKLQLFLADGTVKTFNASEDDIDDTDIISAAGAWNASNITSGAIVKYGVDKDGTITDMNIGGKDDLQLVGPVTAHVSAKGYVGNRSVDTNAVVFNFVGDTFATSDDSDDYSVLSYEKILDCDDTQMIYFVDTKDKKVVAILAEDAAASEDVFGVVVSKAMNNSDAGAEFKLLIGGKAEIKNGTDASGENKYDVPVDGTGELYLIKFDSNGDVKEFASWKDGGDDAVKAETSGSNVTYSKNEISIETTGGAFTLTTENDAATTADGITLDKGVIVYLKDGKKDWKTVSTSDLRNLAADDYDKIVAYDIVDEDELFDVVLIYK